MKPNDKVVCVDDSLTAASHEFHWPNGRPARGKVYTVREYFPAGHRWGAFVPVPTISIVGYPIIYLPFGCEVAATASRFRLVSEIGHPPIEVQQPEEITV